MSTPENPPPLVQLALDALARARSYDPRIPPDEIRQVVTPAQELWLYLAVFNAEFRDELSGPSDQPWWADYTCPVLALGTSKTGIHPLVLLPCHREPIWLRLPTPPWAAMAGLLHLNAKSQGLPECDLSLATGLLLSHRPSQGGTELQCQTDLPELLERFQYSSMTNLVLSEFFWLPFE